MKIKFEASLAHFKKDLHPLHGPQKWSWWMIFSIDIVRIEISKPSFGYRAWFYTRFGAAYVGVIFDRRKQ